MLCISACPTVVVPALSRVGSTQLGSSVLMATDSQAHTQHIMLLCYRHVVSVKPIDPLLSTAPAHTNHVHVRL